MRLLHIWNENNQAAHSAPTIRNALRDLENKKTLKDVVESKQKLDAESTFLPAFINNRVAREFTPGMMVSLDCHRKRWLVVDRMCWPGEIACELCLYFHRSCSDFEKSTINRYITPVSHVQAQTKAHTCRGNKPRDSKEPRGAMVKY